MVLLYFINIVALIVFSIYLLSLGIRINTDSEEIKKQHKEFMYKQNKINLNNKLILEEIKECKEELNKELTEVINVSVKKGFASLAWMPLNVFHNIGNR